MQIRQIPVSALPRLSRTNQEAGIFIRSLHTRERAAGFSVLSGRLFAVRPKRPTRRGGLSRRCARSSEAGNISIHSQILPHPGRFCIVDANEAADSRILGSDLSEAARKKPTMATRFRGGTNRLSHTGLRRVSRSMDSSRA
jgi:hypothetical protein